MIDIRITEAFEKQNGFPLLPNLVLFATVGSESHGTDIPHTTGEGIDDIDYMGIIIPPVNKFLGLSSWDHWVWQSEELDVVIYSLTKAVSLLLKGNPNIIGTLWLEDKFIHHCSDAGKELIAMREMFSSLDCYNAFVGYAHSQLSKMTSFDTDNMTQYEENTKYIESHGFTPKKVLEATQEELLALVNKDSTLLNKFIAFRTFHRAHFSGYMGEKRRALVIKHGYDTKNAAHLIRLLRMGTEFLATGTLKVFRTDADEIKDIKRGLWPIEKVQQEAEELFIVAKELKTTSPLPDHADKDRAEQWLVQVIFDQLCKSAGDDMWGSHANHLTRS